MLSFRVHENCAFIKQPVNVKSFILNFNGVCSNIGSIGARLVNSLKQVLSSKRTPLPWFLLLSLFAKARECFSLKSFWSFKRESLN